MSGERTEAPTPRRRDEARRRGNVAKSQELVSTGVLLAAVVGLRLTGPALWEDLSAAVREGLKPPPAGDLTTSAVAAMGREAGVHALLAMLPLLAVLMAAGLALNLAQTGLLFTRSGLTPKLSRLNPGAGFKRIFSTEGVVALTRALAKMAVITLVVTFTMKAQLGEIATLSQASIPSAAARLAGLAFDVALRAGGVLFALALLDYAWQRRQHLRQLRMTKEEVRQELRESEGDPQVKAAIRRRRQALLNRMIAAVPKADVVVTNPTHYAVAIKYDPVGMPAPVVVAKGERLLALRIREVALKAGVPVVEEPPLARALYASVAVGGYIPANLFHAVAEVLAWVYALRRRAAEATRRLPGGIGVSTP
ncbi:MAG: flagellar biosynthesis protein FlhB [Dehalococcoidia bacterium]|nr:flagellar biosynthesis protein FlhB [Dehalococcoidia bacterium]